MKHINPVVDRNQFNEYFLWEWWAIKLAPVQSFGTYFDGLTQRDICEKTTNVACASVFLIGLFSSSSFSKPFSSSVPPKNCS